MLGVIPFLHPEWRNILQNSLNLFWDRIGDGRRKGCDCEPCPHPMYDLVAPDGSLGDCVLRKA